MFFCLDDWSLIRAFELTSNIFLKPFTWINFDKIFAEGATKTSQFLVNKFLKKRTIPLWSIEQHILKSSIFFSSKVDWWTSHELWMASSDGPCGCGRSSTQISLGNGWVTLSVFFCEISSILRPSLNYGGCRAWFLLVHRVCLYTFWMEFITYQISK